MSPVVDLDNSNKCNIFYNNCCYYYSSSYYCYYNNNYCSSYYICYGYCSNTYFVRPPQRPRRSSGPGPGRSDTPQRSNLRAERGAGAFRGSRAK